MNVGIILAAGRSTRFLSETPKQIYTIDGKPSINHSIDILSKHLDKVIIITNSGLLNQIKTDCEIIVNDIDNRIQSIKTGLDYIKDQNYDNILIHDSARPFIKSEHIEELINSQKKFKHSQYYLELVNGLAKKNETGWEVAPRQDFIELCSPQITNFKLFKELFYNYIQKGEECEILPIVSKLNLEYNLIRGSNKFLRKITTLDDL